VVEEIALGVLATLPEMGFRGRQAAAAAHGSELTALIGLGLKAPVPSLMKLVTDVPRVLWIGEPMLPPSPAHDWRGANPKARVFESGRAAWRALPEGRFRRAVGRLGGPAAGNEPWHNLEKALGLARVCDAVAVTSRDQVAPLTLAGVPVEVVPYGYSPHIYGALWPSGERDIEVLALGGHSGPTCGRRREWVERWRKDGLNVTVAEDLWGESRTAMLRRTRVVVEVHRFPGTFVGIRLAMALAAGAAVVSEPMTDPCPFVPGVHFVEADVDRIADEARALLADERRRRCIVEAGQALLAEELTMTRSLAAVLALLDRSAHGVKERTASIT
jgi:hypothetical protein